SPTTRLTTTAVVSSISVLGPRPGGMPTPATRFWWSRPAPVSLRTSRKNEKSRWETWCISRPARNTGTEPRRTRHCPTSRSRRLVVRAAGDRAVLSQHSRSLARSEHDRVRPSVPLAHTLRQRYGRHALPAAWLNRALDALECSLWGHKMDTLARER